MRPTWIRRQLELISLKSEHLLIVTAININLVPLWVSLEQANTAKLKCHTRCRASTAKIASLIWALVALEQLMTETMLTTQGSTNCLDSTSSFYWSKL